MSSRFVLSLEQKRELYREGYLVLRGAVAPELVEAARARIRAAQKGENLGPTKEMTDLLNASSVNPILRDLIGTFDPPTTCQVGVRKAAPPGDHFNSLGYRDQDMPFYGAELHMDGNITVNTPQEVAQGTPEEIYRRHFASGPKGPGWPRLNHGSPNRCGMNYLPDVILEQFLDDHSECTPDGRRWPRPTQILMEQGDACIASYHIPHSGTRNERGSESRRNIIFRIRNKKRQPNQVVNGLSDHPDRGQMGEWLEFEQGNNPWETSKDVLCNMWDEWEGLHEVVADERARESDQV